MRGYAVWNEIGRKSRLDAVVKHFSKIKQKMMLESQILIAYYVRKFIKSKEQRKKREQEKAMQENIRKKDDEMRKKATKIQSYIQSNKNIKLFQVL